MFKKRVETFDAIRWDGENQEIIQGQLAYPTKKAGFGSLEIKTGDKEKVNIKKGYFAVKSKLTGEITSCSLEEFEKIYQTAR